MSKPSISIVLATFNGAAFLREQLESLFAQTEPPCELIISDDGSSDDTLAIAQWAQGEAPFPVRIVRNPERLGYGENFLSAAGLATGDFVAFCDQDDVWDAGKLEKAVRSLAESGAHLHVHEARIIDSAGVRLGTFTQGIGRAAAAGPREMAPWGVFYGFSMVFRRELLTLIPHGDRGGHTFEHSGLLSHDLWVYFLAWSLGSTVMEPEPLASYRRHGANETPDQGGWLKRLSASLGTPARAALKRGDVARHRAKILRDLAARLADDSPYASEARTSAAYWARIATYEDARVGLYEGATPFNRVNALLRLAGAGGYAKWSKGGLGARLLVKDALFGVLKAAKLRPGRASPIPSLKA